MRKGFILGTGLLLLAVLPPGARVEGSGGASAAKWAARYTGSGCGLDRALAMAVDRAGNVVVTGESAGGRTYAFDFATVKYSAAGKRLWVRRYDGGDGGRDDRAAAVAVDRAGNVFVAGTTTLSRGAFILTVKYSAAGKRLWVRMYDDGVSTQNEARAVAVDGSGCVYVAGEVWSFDSATNCDAVVIKYDAAGKKLWAKKYNHSANGWDSLYKLATDGAGFVYGAGISWGAGSHIDYVTLKLRANGALVWARRYNGPANEDDRARDIAVDVAGNVYVTGESRGTDSFFDYATVSYDAAGRLLWARRYDGPGHHADSAAALGVDSAGNVYVTGSSEGAAGDADAATVKYGPGGERGWVLRYDGPGKGRDEGTDLVLDPAGNVYVTGTSLGSDRYLDYVTMKIDPTGAPFWIRRYNGAGRSDDLARAVALDPSGNALVTGQSYGKGTGYDYVTIKY